MSLLSKMKRTLLGTGLATVGAGVCVAAIAQQPPGEPPPSPPPPERPDVQAEQTHTAIVVDLMSYIEKQKEHERRQREQRRRETPERPAAPPPREPGSSPGAHAPQQPPEQRQTPPRPDEPRRDSPQRERERERDRGIDWTAGDYRENLEAGVPMVLMIEEESPWGPAEARAHVVTFDPDNADSKESFQALKRSAGERVEVVGDVHKERAVRGLRALTVHGVE